MAQRVEADKKHAEFDAYSKWQDAWTIADDVIKMQGVGRQLRELPPTPARLQEIQRNDSYVTTKLGELHRQEGLRHSSGTVEFTRLATDHCRWDANLGQERSKDLATRCLAVYSAACP